MLVDLTKDELKTILYYIDGKDFMPDGKEIKSIQYKLNPLLKQWTCKEKSND